MSEVALLCGGSPQSIFFTKENRSQIDMNNSKESVNVQNDISINPAPVIIQKCVPHILNKSDELPSILIRNSSQGLLAEANHHAQTKMKLYAADYQLKQFCERYGIPVHRHSYVEEPSPSIKKEADGSNESQNIKKQPKQLKQIKDTQISKKEDSHAFISNNLMLQQTELLKKINNIIPDLVNGFYSIEKKSIISDELFYDKKKTQLEEYCTRMMRQIYSLDKDILLIEKAIRSSSLLCLNSKHVQEMTIYKRIITKYIWINKQLKGMELHNKYRWMETNRFIIIYKQYGLSIERLNECCSQLAFPVDDRLVEHVHSLLLHVEMLNDTGMFERTNQSIHHLHSSSKSIKRNALEQKKPHHNPIVKKPIFNKKHTVLPLHNVMQQHRSKVLNSDRPKTKIQTPNRVKPNLNEKVMTMKTDVLREMAMTFDHKFDSIMESLNIVNRELQKSKSARQTTFEEPKKIVEASSDHLQSENFMRKNNAKAVAVKNEINDQHEKSTQVTPNADHSEENRKYIMENLGTIESFHRRLEQLQEEEDEIRHRWNSIHYEEVKTTSTDGPSNNISSIPEAISFTKDKAPYFHSDVENICESALSDQLKILTFTKNVQDTDNKFKIGNKLDSIQNGHDLRKMLFLSSDQVKSIKRNRDDFKIWSQTSKNKSVLQKISVEDFERAADHILNAVIKEVADEISLMTPTIVNEVFNREFNQLD